ncbi:MAG: glycosyl hydrolase [Bacteroidota bacterium]
MKQDASYRLHDRVIHLTGCKNRGVIILNRYFFVAVGLVCWLGIGCSSKEDSGSTQPALIDTNATEETHALYHNLHAMKGKHALFGHQATLSYGYTWMNEPNRSDVKDVTGSFPALYGWDVADFIRVEHTAEDAIMAKKKSLGFATEALKRGGVLTYSWHQFNPVTKGSFYDTTPAVHTLLPGGEHHETYQTTLDSLASYFNALNPMPVIFRPYHEHNGDWFWWGKGLTSEEDYIALWRFTVEYLRDQKGVHNLIWAFSPDRSRLSMESFEEEYAYGYPGDEYVDIIGLDNYWDVGHKENKASKEVKNAQFVESLARTAGIARKKNKIAALTETGLEALPDSLWWTGTLLKSMQYNELTREIVYLQVWRNANKEKEQRDHFYAPYPGQKSADDFIRFKESTFILFEDALPGMYENGVNRE